MTIRTADGPIEGPRFTLISDSLSRIFRANRWHDRRRELFVRDLHLAGISRQLLDRWNHGGNRELDAAQSRVAVRLNFVEKGESQPTCKKD